MIRTEDILQALYGVLRSAFPGIWLWDQENEKIAEKDRPCFVVEFDDMTSSKLTWALMDESIEATIYYFHSSRNKGYAELLKMKSQLTELFFRTIEVKEHFYISIDNIDFDIDKQDMVLSALFNIYSVQSVPEDDGDYQNMEELEWRNDAWECQRLR